MTKSGPPITTALRCFTCGYTNADDHLCIDDPISVQGQSIVTCSKKYCTIQRQELQTPAGKVQSFVRDCQEVPPVSYRSIIITPFTEKLHKNIYNWHNVLVFIAIVMLLSHFLFLSFHYLLHRRLLRLQVLDGIIEDDTFKTFYRSCTTDLCNSGNLMRMWIIINSVD